MHPDGPPRDAPEDVVVRDLTEDDARAVAGWRYDGPWAVYDGTPDQLISADLGYHAVEERGSGRLLGFFCLGAEARVAGLAALDGVCDFGLGLDPAVVGRGRGARIMAPVLDWIAAHRGAPPLRAVVQSWNERSLRFCRALGFEVVGLHQAPQGGTTVDYVVLVRPPGPASGPAPDPLNAQRV